MNYEIKKHGNDYDNDDVRFYKDNAQVGFGFISHDSGELGLQSCPECGKENYALNVSTGICAWCGWDGNKMVQPGRTYCGNK